MFRKKLQRFMVGTLVAGLLCSQIVGASAQSTTNEEPASSSNVYIPVVTDGSQPEDQIVENGQILTDTAQFPANEEPQGISGDNSISAAEVNGFDVPTWMVQNRLGVGTTTPNHLLSVIGGPAWTTARWGGSMELANGTAIGWRANTGNQRFGFGHTNGGFYIFRTVSELGTTTNAASYDLAINDSGNVGIGTTNPQAKLDVYGTANNQWGMTIGSLGGSAKGLLISTAWPGSPNVPLFQANAGGPGYDVPRFVIQANGNVGIGTITPTAKIDILGSGNQSIQLSSSDLGSQTKLMAVTSNGKVESQMQFRNEFHFGEMAHLQGAPVMSLFGSGRVGIGTTTPQSTLHVNGTTTTKVLQITGGADLAEPFAVTGAGTIDPGMVVAIDPENPGQMRLSDKAYNHMVAGVVSGAGDIKPGLILQQEGTVAVGAHPVALSGRIYVWADTTNGAIQPGDLLTTSTTPGHAMKVTDSAQAQGAVLGKAMGRLESGTGLVLMLVTLQ